MTTFIRGRFSLSIAVIAMLVGCSPAGAQPKSHAADAGHPPPHHRAKSARADGGVATKKERPLQGIGAAPRDGGTEVGAPRLSNDPCTRDEDCAPVAMCHSDRCVSAARAGSMPADVMCTMECRGGTVDCGFNHCACVASSAGKKVCALVPGPPRR